MPYVREINDFDELDDLKLVWDSLLGRTRDATFFQSLEWFKIHWGHFARGRKLRVLAMSDDAGPVGILPLVVWDETTRVGSVRVLGYPMDDWGTFYGPIGPYPTATLTLGMKHLAQTARDWDLIDLRGIDLRGADHGRTQQALRLADFDPHQQPWFRAAVVDLEGTWEEYWSNRPSKWRRSVANCQNRMNRAGRVEYVRCRPAGTAYGDDDPRLDLYDQCLEIARRSWQGSSEDGNTLCHEDVRDFLREAHVAAARAGTADLNLLMLDGEPAAFIYGYCCRDRVYALRTGFDPQFGFGCPGKVLWRYYVEDCFRRGDRQIDLGVGSFEWKEHWLTRTVTSYRTTHYAVQNPRAQLLHLKRWFQDHFADPETLVLARSR